MKKRKRAALPPPVKAPIANPYDSGSELENPCSFEYDSYNRSLLVHELGVVELNKGFATHRPRMSFDSEASTDQGPGRYDDDYAPDSLHRNKSAQVSAVDPIVNGLQISILCPFALLLHLHRRRPWPLHSALVANV